jgi:hypothetical protein
MDRRSVMTLVGLAVVAVVAAGCDIEAESGTAEGSFERTMKVNGPVDLEVLSRSGRIDVTVGERDTVRVIGRIQAHGAFLVFGGYTPEEQVKSLESSPPIEQTGDAIRIGDIHDPAFGNVSISYTVTVPADTRLRTSSRSGDQTIESVLGPVEASSRSGSIRVGRVARDAEIETRSGEVDVRLPSDGGARLEVQTRSGAVDSDVPMLIERGHSRHVSGTIGRGDRRVQVYTRSGSVRIR